MNLCRKRAKKKIGNSTKNLEIKISKCFPAKLSTYNIDKGFKPRNESVKLAWAVPRVDELFLSRDM